MQVKLIVKTMLLGLALTGLVACTGKGHKKGGAGDEQAAVEQSVSTEAANQTKTAEELAAEQEALQQADRTVYFAYDNNSVGGEYQDMLATHARYLISNPGVKVRLEGNCDERGTPEYNIALGERRAQAVARVLQNHNVPAAQIETVSFGEEKPAVVGHNESAWAKNRRVEIKY